MIDCNLIDNSRSKYAVAVLKLADSNSCGFTDHPGSVSEASPMTSRGPSRATGPRDKHLKGTRTVGYPDEIKLDAAR